METALFEKVPQEQFALDGGGDIANVRLPVRATAGSAGYDFFLPHAIELAPGEKITVPSGVRCLLAPSCFLAIVPKSGLGTKYCLGLANTVGIIDSDYYGAKNFGHILVALINRGAETVILPQGKAFVQGIILPYLTADNDGASGTRTGGHGSTGL